MPDRETFTRGRYYFLRGREIFTRGLYVSGLWRETLAEGVGATLGETLGETLGATLGATLGEGKLLANQLIIRVGVRGVTKP